MSEEFILEDLMPPTIPERTISDVQFDLIAVSNEIQSIEMRLEFLRDQEWKLQEELRSLQPPITQRSQRNIDHEREYIANFVMEEIGLKDIFDI